MTKQQQQQWYRDNKGQKINQENYDYSDSKSVQIRSVIEFMSELNYDYYPVFNQTFGARYKEGFKGCEVISWQTAVKLHDASWMRTQSEYILVPEFSSVNKWGGGYYERTFQVDAYTLNKAQAAKIVERVYIHCTKHGVLKAYKDQVQMTDQAYQQQFLKPIIEKEGV